MLLPNLEQKIHADLHIIRNWSELWVEYIAYLDSLGNTVKGKIDREWHKKLASHKWTAPSITPSVRFRWPAYTGGDYSGYLLRWGYAPDALTNEVNAGVDDLFYDLPGNIPFNTQYYYSVVALTPEGEQFVVWQHFTASQPVFAPRNLRAALVEYDYVELHFDMPVEAPKNGFLLYRSEDGGPFEVYANRNWPSNEPFQDTWLKVETGYRYYVTSYNLADDGVYLETESKSNIVYIKTPKDRVGPALSQVTVLPVGNQVSIRYGEPVQLDGAPQFFLYPQSNPSDIITLTYASGNGTNTLTMNTSRTIHYSEYILAENTAGPEGVKDIYGNPAYIYTSFSAQNTSTQGYLVYENITGTVPEGWVNTGTLYNWTAREIFESGWNYHLRFTSSSNAEATHVMKTFTASDSIEFLILYKVSTMINNPVLVQIEDSAGNKIFSINGGAGSNITIRNSANTVIGQTQNTSFIGWLWGSYTKGTGNNAVITVRHNSSTTKPTMGGPNTASVTTGTMTQQAARIKLLRTNGTLLDIDRIRVSSTTIGNAA